MIKNGEFFIDIADELLTSRIPDPRAFYCHSIVIVAVHCSIEQKWKWKTIKFLYFYFLLSLDFMFDVLDSGNNKKRATTTIETLLSFGCDTAARVYKERLRFFRYCIRKLISMVCIIFEEFQRTKLKSAKQS